MASDDRQNTSQKPSGKKAKPLSQKEQSERFKATALDLESDETGEAFERALHSIMRPSKSEKS